MAKRAGSWRRGPKVQVTCEHCGKEFEALVSRREKGWDRFCSYSCSQSHNATVGNEKRWAKGELPYVRMNSQSRVKEQLRDAADRKCQHCGQPEVGRRLDVHRMTRSVMGGKYETGQVLVLCRSCHIKLERAG